VWFARHGWVPVDPTPGVPPVAAPVLSDHWAAGGLARLIPHLQLEAPVAALGSLGALAALPAALACGALAILVIVWWRRRPRKRRAQPAPGESELLRLYERLQRRAGRRRAPPETPLEYLHQVGPATARSLLQDVTEAVNAGAYAGRWPSPQKVREMTERLS
jgi:hypothetical protein